VNISRILSSMSVETIDPLGFRAWHGRPLPMGVEHSHGDVELNLHPSAPLDYRIGGAQARLPAGRLGLLWGAVPHQLLAVDRNPDHPAFWVTIPLERLLRWDAPRAFIRDLLAGKLLVDRGDDPDLDVLMLRRWVLDLANAPDGRPDRTMELEVQARIQRMALRHGWDVVAGRRHHGIVSDDPVERMARHIVDHHDQPMTVAGIAAEVGWHSNYAMTRFRAATGSTVVRYLTSQRVAHAQRLLVTSDRPILDVGLEAGFGSISRFHAAFRAVTGQSPAAYRRSMRADDGSA